MPRKMPRKMKKILSTWAYLEVLITWPKILYISPKMTHFQLTFWCLWAPRISVHFAVSFQEYILWHDQVKQVFKLNLIDWPIFTNQGSMPGTTAKVHFNFPKVVKPAKNSFWSKLIQVQISLDQKIFLENLIIALDFEL